MIRVVLVTGVSGVGKSTVGRALAARLGWRFVEGDEHHLPESVAKMGLGEPLTETDRDPWLRRLEAVVDDLLASGDAAPGGVVAVSALRRAHRRRLRAGDPRVLLVFLAAPRDLLERRLAERTGHFFGPDLVASQLAALEEPRGAALRIDAGLPVDEIVGRIAERVGGAAQRRE